MMNVEYLTECYIKVYEKTLEKTNDPSFAINAATTIITLVANIENNKKQATKSGRMSEDYKEKKKCQEKQDLL